MGETFEVTESNFSKAERRLLLFQVDLGNRDLNTVLGTRGATDQRSAKDAVRISDPVDYDNPASPVYWRKMPSFSEANNKNGYVKTLAAEFKTFMKQFQDAISDGTIKLKGTGGQASKSTAEKSFGPADPLFPYIDMSDFTKTIDGYSVRSDSLENNLNIVLARPDSTDLVGADQSIPGEIVVNFNDDVFGQLNPNENDIVVIKAAYSPTDNFQPEYIGMVTKVVKSFRYGAVDSFNIEVSGLSKILASSQMIKNKAVRGNEFIPGIELNDKARNTNFSSNFNDKDVRGNFRYILEDALACKEIDIKTANFLYRLDPRAFISFEKFGFQHNIFVLIALYLMSITEAPQGAEGSLEARLFPQLEPTANLETLVPEFNSDVVLDSATANVEPRLATRPILDFFLRGTVERGNHRAYNKMARNGVLKFFSEMTRPSEILSEIRSNSYSDIFESRDGVIVCRPPRYNKVESTQSEADRVSAEADYKLLLQLSPQNVWEFNPNSDFVIKSEEMVSMPSISKNELALESRIDVKPIYPLKGELDYPSGLFIDPDILFRYGLRSHGPVTNPNAYNKKLTRLFAPIALAMINAPSRTIEITVKDNRKFFVGKLYYLESIDMVAYLVQDTINHSYSGLSTRNLSFTMLRQVMRRSITEILKNDDEVLNVGMMFATDFPDEKGLEKLVAAGFQFQQPKSVSGAVSPTPKNLMFTKGKQFLENLQKNSALGPFQDESQSGTSPRTSVGFNDGIQATSDVRLVMFKYTPCIEDLIMEIESTPHLADPPAESSNNIDNAKKSAKNARLEIYVDRAGFLYYTAGFKVAVETDRNFRLDFTQLINDVSSKPIKKREKEVLPGLDLLLRTDYAQQDENAPMAMAGLIGYVYPTLPKPGSISVTSPFVEVPGYSRISFFKSPFVAQALSNPPKNIELSQVVMNKLVDFDLSLKFDPPIIGKITSNYNGIQQFYSLDLGVFVLFATASRPSDYLKNLVVGSRDPIEINIFQDQMLKSVGCLKLNKDKSAFENDFFSIPIREGAFDLPFGHLVHKFGNNPGDMSFYKTYGSSGPREGGKFRIISGPLKDEFLVSPQENQAKVEDGNNGDITEYGGTLHLSAPNGLYFMSPFMEPTIERLLDIHMPTEFGGNLSSSEAQKQSKLSSKGVLMSQAKRQKGQAVNVSIDVLVLASNSNVQIVGGIRPPAIPLGGAGVPPIYQRFEKYGSAVFKGGAGGAMLPIRNALKGNWRLAGGQPLGKRDLMIYTLQIEEFVENHYASRLQNDSVAATVT